MKLINKQSVVILLSALVVFSSASAVAADAAAKPAAASVGIGDVGPDGMPVLAKKSNCAACHAMDKKLLGPSWMDVSRKYKGVSTYKFSGKDYPLEEGLIIKVSKGGAGVWGTMPMPANSPAVKNEDIKALVQYVIGVAK